MQNIIEVLELARYAPSVHNTQPWYFKVAHDHFSVHIDPNHILSHGDPVHRELWLSMGALIECIMVSAEALGITLVCKVPRNLNIQRSVATFHYESDHGLKHNNLKRIIINRRSFRGELKSNEPSATEKDNLEQLRISIDPKHVFLLYDKQQMYQIADLTFKGMRIALGDKDFRSELAALVLPNWDRGTRGMHGQVLGKTTMLGSYWEHLSLAQGWGLTKKARQEHERIVGSSGLLLITSTGDTPTFWLAAGREYYQALIKLFELGYESSTTAAAVEAGTFHEDIEAMLHLDRRQRLQVIIRFGKPLEPIQLKHSARVALKELLRD